jgi:hypothetical protein
MSKVFKAVKKIIPAALPIAASLIPGIGPLGMAAAGAAGGALGGGGLKGALLGGALSGLGAGMFGAAPAASGFSGIDSLNSGLFKAMSPLQSIGSSIKTGLGDLFSPLKGLLGGGTASMTSPNQLVGGLAKQNPLPWLTEAAGETTLPWLADSAQQASSGSFLDKIMNSVSNLDLKDAATMASLVSQLNPEKGGMLSQQDIVARMDADRAKQEANNSKFISGLNSSPINREQTNPNIDYYNYGYRPEVSFFDDVAGGQAKFAKGGKVRKAESPLAGLGGQDDTINAKLSAGEYVIPADVVSFFGDGNTDAGAKKFDDLLKNIRKHKAPALKKGSLPPKAKSPLSYMGAVA